MSIISKLPKDIFNNIFLPCLEQKKYSRLLFGNFKSLFEISKTTNGFKMTSVYQNIETSKYKSIYFRTKDKLKSLIYLYCTIQSLKEYEEYFIFFEDVIEFDLVFIGNKNDIIESDILEEYINLIGSIFV
jgi:hypothetical protein